MQPFISLIVAVRNEKAHIERLLDSLINQKINHSFEILLIDGMSDDGTYEILKDFQEHHHNVHIFQNKKQRVTHGRNIGIKKAKGSYVAYIDGHSYADPHWLSNLTHTLTSAPHNVAGVGTTLQPPDDETLFQKTTSDVFATTLGGGNSSYAPIKKPINVKTAHFFLYRKKILDNVGNYNPYFVTNQDADLNMRIIKAGYKLLKSPNAIAHQYNRDTLPLFRKQMFRYGHARARFFLTHPGFHNFLLPFLFFTAIPLLLLLGFLNILFLLAGALLFLLFTAATLFYSLSIAIKHHSLSAGKTAFLLYWNLHSSFYAGFIKGLFSKEFIQDQRAEYSKNHN